MKGGGGGGGGGGKKGGEFGGWVWFGTKNNLGQIPLGQGVGTGWGPCGGGD